MGGSRQSRHRLVDTPARAVRRLLSGDDSGEPEFVKRMARPGDTGLFGPGSVVWRVHGSTTTLIGGLRALILQTLQPSALAGVTRHSRFREDPIGRLQNTARFVTVATYASTQQVVEECELIQRVHRAVRGVDPFAGPYDASDPVLLRYVHLSLVDSFLATYQAYSGDPLTADEADRYVQEMNRLAPLLGFAAIQLPTSVPEMRGMLTPDAAGLAVSGSTVETLRFLMDPPLPRTQRLAYPILLRAAAATLPLEIAALLPGHFPQPKNVASRRIAVTGGSLVSRALAVVLGESPALRFARDRCAA